MNTRNYTKAKVMPPQMYEAYEKTRKEFEAQVKTPVTRQQLSYASYVYGNKLKSITREN